VIDSAGLGAFTAGVTALLIGVLEAGRVTSWTGLDVAGPFALAIAALAAFLRHRAARARADRARCGCSSSHGAGAAVTGFLAGMAMFGAISFVPLYLQVVSDMSATAAGVVLIPFVLGWVAMSITSARPRAAHRLSHRRRGAAWSASRWPFSC
jgi:hypothetical protein